MEIKELIQALRADAEWAHANEWETPITLGDHLDAGADALAAVTAERDEAVNELHGKCQYCARQPMRRLSDGQLDALCATCQEYNKCNWKYRGTGKEQNNA